MGLLDQKLDDVPDLRSVEPGEYKLRIESAEEGVGQTSNKPYVKARISLPDVPEAKDINHFLSMPTDYDDEKTAMSKVRRIKAFLIAFGIPTEGMTLAEAVSERNLERMKGREAWAILEEEEDEQYGSQNRIKRFM